MELLSKYLLAVSREGSIPDILKVSKIYVEKPEQELFDFYVDYVAKSKKLPNEKVVVDTFGESEDLDEDYSGTVEHYMNLLQKRYLRTELAGGIPKAMRSIARNPKKALAELQTLIMSLESGSSSRDSTYSEDADERYDDYEERKKTGGVTYLSAGNDILDDLFYGYQKGDLITIGGRPGMKKTWLMCYLCILAAEELPKDAGPILFLTNEMTTKAIKDRFDAIIFELPYADFLKGDLSRKKESSYRRGLKKIGDMPVRFIEDCYTIEDLEYKISFYRPSMIFIDGVYLFHPEMDEGFAKNMFLTRGVKRVAKREELPIVQSTQLRKKGGSKSVSFAEGQDDFMYGGYIQDSDIAFRLFQSKDMVYHSYYGADIAKGRRVNPEQTLQFCMPMEEMKFSLSIREKEPDTEIVEF